MRKIFLTLISLVCFLFVASPAMAVTNLSIRLAEPKSPTNLNDFEIGFVALDLLNREVTVQCQKKSSTDADFVSFDSAITLTAGGNTDACHITSAVFSHNDTYQIKVIATAGADTASDQVEIKYNTVGPDTPSEYNKEKISACTYKISFKTGNDSGRTSKVEVYRSESTSFTADSGTRVETVSAGSNEAKSVNNDIPDCNKTYYYAVRAFDTAGNGSGIVGDQEIVTVATTTTGTPASPTTGAFPLSSPTGNVLGEETIADTQAEASNVPSVSPAESAAQVLGAKNNLPLTLGLGALFLVILGYVVYKYKGRLF